MKNNILSYLSLAFIGICLFACNEGRTYAEQTEDEKNAIRNYIAEQNIKTISVEEFEKDTVTDVSQNEYVMFPDGVYLQIVDRGSKNAADTIKNNDVLLIRFIEKNIMTNDTTLFNVFLPEFGDASQYYSHPDAMSYREKSGSIYGQYLNTEEYTSVMGIQYGSSVPTGWLIPLKYLRNNAHIKLIVSHRSGHTNSAKFVQPYFYDLRKIQIE